MASSFAEHYAGSRRLFILRFLAQMNGTANESVVYSAALRGGFAQTTRDDIRRDLDFLKESGCTAEEWLERLRVVTLTERGEDVAHGRAECAGVEHSIWRR